MEYLLVVDKIRRLFVTFKRFLFLELKYFILFYIFMVFIFGLFALFFSRARINFTLLHPKKSNVLKPTFYLWQLNVSISLKSVRLCVIFLPVFYGTRYVEKRHYFWFFFFNFIFVCHAVWILFRSFCVPFF